MPKQRKSKMSAATISAEVINVRKRGLKHEFRLLLAEEKLFVPFDQFT